MAGSRSMAAMLVGMAMAVALGSAAQAAQLPDRIVDAGLHRQWLVERDRTHPERPGRLVEVPWSSAAKARSGRPLQQAAVRCGMKVTVWRHNGRTDLRLMGTALDAGRVGETVRVRAGLHGAVLRGVVRGPADVELERGRS